jgi:hypothetical protein
VRDIDLFGQFLVRLRQEKLQLSHATLTAGDTGWAEKARMLALEADLCSRIHGALKELEKDPGAFIQHHLRRETRE